MPNVPVPTGDEKPQHQYVSPYLDNVEAITREVKSAAADGREPNLAGYTAVDLAGAGVIVANPSTIEDQNENLKEEKLQEARDGLPKVNDRGATTTSVKASDSETLNDEDQEKGIPADQENLPNQSNNDPHKQETKPDDKQADDDKKNTTNVVVTKNKD